MRKGQYLWLLAPFLAMGTGILFFQSGWIALLLYHLLIVIALVVNRERIFFRKLFEGFSLFALLIMVVIATGLYFAITEYAIANEFTGSKVERLVGSCGILFCVYLLVVNPVLEELFWRELFASKSKWPTPGDFLFGCFHSLILFLFLPLPGVILVVFTISLVGYGWRRLRWRHSGLLLPWLGHLLADAMLIGVVLRLLHS